MLPDRRRPNPTHRAVPHFSGVCEKSMALLVVMPLRNPGIRSIRPRETPIA
jgi:hypothetical protein